MKGLSKTMWLVIVLIIIVVLVFVFGKSIGLPGGLGLY